MLQAHISATKTAKSFVEAEVNHLIRCSPWKIKSYYGWRRKRSTLANVHHKLSKAKACVVTAAQEGMVALQGY